ncbi:Uncharacterized OsmC-related protein [Enhydrobacter aerosaccus]|uniref:Uncharacterized OsmC-related protein n=1 Tax=Enhydrobacter aerosaccus TaxID=225324 RepID=A0A1T4THY7_9HYPH|nr:OsmC family protein [Enhydrobacter aerosaccus]SKA40070.1 Uncharacterized OsmC-related protein [Enhydrobacter aerosaccus]
MTSAVSITLTRQANYKFLVDYGPGLPGGTLDEPAPLGGSEGPSPVQALVTAVAGCLSASFVFALAKFKEDPGPVAIAATCSLARNEYNRMRVTGVDVTLKLGTPPQTLAHLQRALAQFEDFCTVSQSIRAGIPYTLKVVAPDGEVVKAA